MIGFFADVLNLLYKFVEWLKERKTAAQIEKAHQDAIDALAQALSKKDTSKIENLVNSDRTG